MLPRRISTDDLVSGRIRRDSSGDRRPLSLTIPPGTQQAFRTPRALTPDSESESPESEISPHDFPPVPPPRRHSTSPPHLLTGLRRQETRLGFQYYQTLPSTFEERDPSRSPSMPMPTMPQFSEGDSGGGEMRMKLDEETRKLQERVEKIKENRKKASVSARQSTDKESGVRNTLLAPRIASLFQFLRDSGSKVQRDVDEMDKRLAGHTTTDRERLKLFNKLCKTCSRHRVIPRSMHIPDCSEGSVEVESGGFANVSQSTYEGRLVAIKVVRVYVTSDLDVILSRFCREGIAWKHLLHPNILPLLGVTISGHCFALVSEWMENGNINEFIERDQHVNRVELLAGVANGLKYMHGLRMVHGDLKGANILINGDRRACLADFGLSTITGVATHAAAGASRVSLISLDSLMSFTGGGTRRWMSPELLHPEMFGMPESEDNRPTRQSDCYALGMVIYEVLCGHHPYLEFSSDIMAVDAIMKGVRPKKPEGAKQLGFSHELWRIVELSWQEDRNARPGVEDIHSCLNEASAFWYMREF